MGASANRAQAPVSALARARLVFELQHREPPAVAAAALTGVTHVGIVTLRVKVATAEGEAGMATQPLDPDL